MILDSAVNAVLLGFLLHLFEARDIWDVLLMVLSGIIIVILSQHVLQKGYVQNSYLFLFDILTSLSVTNHVNRKDAIYL